jgi:ribonuclease inhibitor
VDERIELVEIDLKGVTSSAQLQLLLMKRLEFPAFYGCNWYAFWDAITGLVEMPRVLRFSGWTSFVQRLPNEAQAMQECLTKLTEMYPDSGSLVEYL